MVTELQQKDSSRQRDLIDEDRIRNQFSLVFPVHLQYTYMHIIIECHTKTIIYRSSVHKLGTAHIFSGKDETQIKLMQEPCILVDDEDQNIGQASKQYCHLMTNIKKGWFVKLSQLVCLHDCAWPRIFIHRTFFE